jgi:hypothetical protein
LNPIANKPSSTAADSQHPQDLYWPGKNKKSIAMKNSKHLNGATMTVCYYLAMEYLT